MHRVYDKPGETTYAPMAPQPIVGPLTNNSRGESRTDYRDTGCVFRKVRISYKCTECPLSVCQYDNREPAIAFAKELPGYVAYAEYNKVVSKR